MRASDLTGQRFGKLVALERVQGGSSKWLCQCDCGNTKTVYATNLKNGATMSCGCSKLIHGDAGSKLYHVHLNMGRNELCEEWKNYVVFKQWAMDNGYRDGVKVCRIDATKPFGPDNCVIKPRNLKSDA